MKAYNVYGGDGVFEVLISDRDEDEFFEMINEKNWQVDKL